MSTKSTELLEGVVITPDTLDSNEDFYTKSREKVVSTLAQLFPEVNSWRSIERASNTFTYYQPFKGVKVVFTVKEYGNRLIVIHVRPQGNDEGSDYTQLPELDANTNT